MRTCAFLRKCAYCSVSCARSSVFSIRHSVEQFTSHLVWLCVLCPLTEKPKSINQSSPALLSVSGSPFPAFPDARPNSSSPSGSGWSPLCVRLVGDQHGEKKKTRVIFNREFRRRHACTVQRAAPPPVPCGNGRASSCRPNRPRPVTGDKSGLPLRYRHQSIYVLP